MGTLTRSRPLLCGRKPIDAFALARDVGLARLVPLCEARTLALPGVRVAPFATSAGVSSVVAEDSTTSAIMRLVHMLRVLSEVSPRPFRVGVGESAANRILTSKERERDDGHCGR